MNTKQRPGDRRKWNRASRPPAAGKIRCCRVRNAMKMQVLTNADSVAQAAAKFIAAEARASVAVRGRFIRRCRHLVRYRLSRRIYHRITLLYRFGERIAPPNRASSPNEGGARL